MLMQVVHQKLDTLLTFFEVSSFAFGTVLQQLEREMVFHKGAQCS